MNYVKKTRPAPWTTAFPKQVSRPARLLRAAMDREYSRLRKKFLAEHRLCQCCIAGYARKPLRSVQVHHKRGRKGSNYLDTTTWAAVCARCHDLIHRDPKWARENGFLGSFIAK